MKARFQVQDLWRKVKDFLLNAMGKEFLVFLFFLALCLEVEQHNKSF